MGDVERAALTLGLVTLAFAAVVFAVWWMRRPRPEPAAPSLSAAPREFRLPKIGRKPVEEVVEMAPSRLARISGKAPTGEPADPPEWTEDQASDRDIAAAPPPSVDAGPALVEAMLATAAAEVERATHAPPAGEAEAEAISIRLVPQIPPRDAILTHSWLGGRPRLPAAMDWPRIDGLAADFLAQIGCAGLPVGLWGGLGPRQGSLALFSHPDSGAPLMLHLAEDGPPRDPPGPPGPAYFGPHAGVRFGDFAAHAIRAFPEWPVDLVAVGPADTDPRQSPDSLQFGGDGPAGDARAPVYDIADPAFHPFDWETMLAMAQILESRLKRLPEEDEAASEEVRERASEIIAIIRDSVGGAAFSASDATAVMAALHAIRWTRTVYRTDPDSGEEQVEALTLPLTRHDPDAPLWVHDYLAILFDHAKHAWCANPDALSGPARAYFEPLWQGLAARQMAAAGHIPFRYAHGFDDERDAVLLELPTSGLMSRWIGEGGNLVLTIRKADLAAGDFSRVQRHVGA